MASMWISSSVIRRSSFPFVVSRNVQLLTSFKFADNSDNAKRVTSLDKPYCIGLPKGKKVAGFGEVVTIAHRGKVHKALVVSNRFPSKTLPRYDHWYIALLNNNLEPAATRLTIPIPSQFRLQKKKYSKIIAIAKRFI
jgi:ribosomal protein L14